MRPEPRSTAAQVKQALRESADPEKAAFYPRFFKTGKGQYGEGDRFLGVTVPKQRRISRRFRSLPLAEISELLDDAVHECRLTALLILVEQFERGDLDQREEVFELYLSHLERVNNWDLVDSSAHKILGAYLDGRGRDLLYQLATSGHLWRQRIAMIACLHFIKKGDFSDALAIAEILLDHDHDLIHKAVGWMLREIGNRDLAALEGFLADRYRAMPRTMLRNAIEKMEPLQRKAYLKGKPDSAGSKSNITSRQSFVPQRRRLPSGNADGPANERRRSMFDIGVRRGVAPNAEKSNHF